MKWLSAAVEIYSKPLFLLGEMCFDNHTAIRILDKWWFSAHILLPSQVFCTYTLTIIIKNPWLRDVPGRSSVSGRRGRMFKMQ